MRHRNFLPILLLALVPAVPVPAQADPDPGAVASARLAADDKDKKDKDKKDKDHKWKDDDRDRDRDRGRGDDDRNGRHAQGVPPGHLPPPGECRVWYDDEPPGHQPPPTDCATARREASRNGGRVIYGDDRRDDRWDDHRDDDRWDDRWGDWDGERWLSRFDTFDRNDDGYLQRSEWTADARVFDFIDVNDDARLSRNEVRDAWNRSREQRDDRSQRRGVRLEDRFRDSDDNRDGRLSEREWWGRGEAFDRLDLNNDGYLTWVEVAGRNRAGR